MCGILGVYRLEIDHQYDDILKTGFRRLLLQSEQRGSDATGAAYVDEDGKLVVAKDNRKAYSFVHTNQYKEFKEDMVNARVIIGHTRLETRGDKKTIQNNHPIFDRKSGIAIVHNGSISNYDKIQEIENFKLDGECDSEMILRVIERFGIEKAVTILRGTFTFAVIDANSPDILQLYKGTNPLYLIYFPEYKWIVFSSDEAYIKEAFSISSSENKILDFFSEEIPVIPHYTESATTDHLLTLSPEDRIKDECILASTDDAYSDTWQRTYTRGGFSSNTYRNSRYQSGYYSSDYSTFNRNHNRVTNTRAIVDKGKCVTTTNNKKKGDSNDFTSEQGCSLQEGIAGLADTCFSCKYQDSCLFALRNLSEDDILLRLQPLTCPYGEDLWKVGSLDEVPCRSADNCGFIQRCKACNKKKRCRKGTKYRRKKAKKLKARIDRLDKEADKYIQDTWKDDDYLLSKHSSDTANITDVFLHGLLNGYLC